MYLYLCTPDYCILVYCYASTAVFYMSVSNVYISPFMEASLINKYGKA